MNKPILEMNDVEFLTSYIGFFTVLGEGELVAKFEDVRRNHEAMNKENECLKAEIERLKELPRELLMIQREIGGRIGVDGQYRYLVPEHVFTLAQEFNK